MEAPDQNPFTRSPNGSAPQEAPTPSPTETVLLVLTAIVLTVAAVALNVGAFWFITNFIADLHLSAKEVLAGGLLLWFVRA